MKQHGFSLFELIITLVILTLILTIGIPSLASQIQNSRTHDAAFSLMAAIENSRALAVAQNKRTVIRAKDKWQDGWDIFIDKDDNGELGEEEALYATSDAFKGVKISGNTHVRNYISFIGTGEGRKVGRANAGAFIVGTIKICPETSGDGYKLVLSRGGRLRVATLSAEDCANVH